MTAYILKYEQQTQEYYSALELCRFLMELPQNIDRSPIILIYIEGILPEIATNINILFYFKDI